MVVLVPASVEISSDFTLSKENVSAFTPVEMISALPTSCPANVYLIFANTSSEVLS